jgi:hypothetical protein
VAAFGLSQEGYAFDPLDSRFHVRQSSDDRSAILEPFGSSQNQTRAPLPNGALRHDASGVPPDKLEKADFVQRISALAHEYETLSAGVAILSVLFIAAQEDPGWAIKH